MYERTQTWNQRLATRVSCDKEMEHCINNTRKDVSECMGVLHLKALRWPSNDREFFCSTVTSIVYRPPTIFVQELSALSKSFDDSSRKPLVSLRRGVSEC